jgi:DNA-binding NarL/FixJ family response regulator
MKIVIVDDHAVVRHGLQSAIQSHGYEVVAVAGSINEAKSFMAQTNPDAIIVDINLPDGSGYDLVSWARTVSPTIAIVVLTLNDGADYIRAAKGAGANAFIVKSAPLSDLLAALDLALSSQSLFSSKNVSPLEIDSGLSAREIDVLQLINLGSSNGAIALNLFISVSTVKTHVSSILRKLDAGNRVQALKIARERGLLIQ